MWPFIKRIFTDETRFVGFFRSLVFGVGLLFEQGTIPVADTPFWRFVGSLAMIGSMMIRSASSQYVPTTPERTTDTGVKPGDSR